jgi:hypothetical protein
MARMEMAAMEGKVDETGAIDNLCYAPCDCYATIASVEPSCVLKFQGNIPITPFINRGLIPG